MRHPDYDRAFHDTPEYIRSAIELGILKGKKAEKRRMRYARALSVAAALVIFAGAGVFGASRLGGRPDNRVPGTPLSGPAATGAADPTAAPTLDPNEPAATPEPTATPAVDPTVVPTAALEEPEETMEPSPEPTAATPEPTVPPDSFATDMETSELWDSHTVYTVYGVGQYFHRYSVCNGQANRRELTASDAINEGLEPCPDCLPTDYTLVALIGEDEYIVSALYCTPQGRYFHIEETCSGMVGARPCTIREILDSSKAACPLCMNADGHLGIVFHQGVENVASDPTVAPTMHVAMTDGSGQIAVSVAASEKEVESTEIGELFPGLDIQSNDTVYVADENHYFHFDPNCPGLEYGKEATVLTAIYLGKGMCPACAPDVQAEALAVTEAESEEVSEMLFYFTDGGTYYHIDPTCSNMRGAKVRSLADGVSMGKRHCPVCIGDNTELYWLPVPEAQDDPAYHVIDSNYYHVNPECFNPGGQSVTVWPLEQIAKKYAPCPICLAALNPRADSPACFAAEGDAFYHSDSQCPEIPAGASPEQTDELHAQAKGKLRCARCAAPTVDSERAKLLVSTFGPGVTDVCPGYIFEREETLLDGSVIWYVSDGEGVMQVATFYYDKTSGHLTNLILQRDAWGTKKFEKTFLSQLPEPFQTVLQNAVDPDTVFQLRPEFDSTGAVIAFELGTFKGNTYGYPHWVVNADGSPEYKEIIVDERS